MPTNDDPLYDITFSKLADTVSAGDKIGARDEGLAAKRLGIMMLSIVD